MALRDAVITTTNRRVLPFDDPVGACTVLNRSIRAWQQDCIEKAGLRLVSQPPDDQPYVAISDRTWLTPALLQRFVRTAQPGQQLQVDLPPLWAVVGGLQQVTAPGVHEVAVMPAGHAPGFDGLQPHTVALEAQDIPPQFQHPALKFAMPGTLPLSHMAIHQVDHWSHLLRANWLALGAHFQQRRVDFRRRNLLVKLWTGLRLLARARSLQRTALAAALTRRGRNCRIHPTATVEASVLGDNVTVGAYAVVRGAWLGDNVDVEEHAVVKTSVLGNGTRVGGRGFVNLSVTLTGAMVSTGDGHQACIFGQDSFVAWGVVTFDLSFGKDVPVMLDGQRVSSGTKFLGAAVGHRARLGGLVQLGFGAEIPNDAFVVGDTSKVLRAWGPGEAQQTRRVVDGVATVVASSSKGPPS